MIIANGEKLKVESIELLLKLYSGFCLEFTDTVNVIFMRRSLISFSRINFKYNSNICKTKKIYL